MSRLPSKQQVPSQCRLMAPPKVDEKARMRGAESHSHTGDGGGSGGRAPAEGKWDLRRRHGRSRWTRSADLGTDLARWMVVWLRSRWRRPRGRKEEAG